MFEHKQLAVFTAAPCQVPPTFGCCCPLYHAWSNVVPCLLPCRAVQIEDAYRSVPGKKERGEVISALRQQVRACASGAATQC